MNHNVGHGHVHPRPDGVRARCGGPRICQVCQAEQAEILTTATIVPTPTRPRLGQVVHYRTYGFSGLLCCAALATEVSLQYEGSYMLGLMVLEPSGSNFLRDVKHSADVERSGTWHWPTGEGCDL